jgi:RNA polymerase sigma-70 factor (family 1)
MALSKGDPEKELLNRISVGDEDAFRIIFDRYRDSIYIFSKYLTRSEFLAEEITQEVFLKIWRYRKNLAAVDFFQAYLKTTARNVYSHYIDRMMHERIILKKLGSSLPGSENSTEHDVDGRALQQLLKKAINELSPQQKKVYLMHKQQGLSYNEVAEELKLSLFTIKEHMRMAMANIRSYIRQHSDLPAFLTMIILLKK